MSLWSERDELVLRYLVEHPPRGGILVTFAGRSDAHDELVQFTHADVHASLEVLSDAGYVAHAEPSWSSGLNRVSWPRFQVTGAGKQTLGLWPRFDALGSPGALAGVLERLAAEAPTDEEEQHLRTAAGIVRRSAPAAVRQLLAGALGAYARSRLGL